MLASTTSNCFPVCSLTMESPKIAVAVYVENGGFGATFGVPIGALIIEQYINGKLSDGSKARANSLQSQHLSYGFKKETPASEKPKTDAAKKDSVKTAKTKK